MLMKPTYANKSLAVKITGYSNLVDALEYAAQGDTGFNFYDGRGHLSTVLPYSDLRDEAMVLARRLLGLGLDSGNNLLIMKLLDDESIVPPGPTRLAGSVFHVTWVTLQARGTVR